jgi:hypothetical protein
MVRAAAVRVVSELLDHEEHEHALASFVTRFRSRMLETLQEGSPAVVVAGLHLAQTLLKGGYIELTQLLYLIRCVARTHLLY